MLQVSDLRVEANHCDDPVVDHYLRLNHVLAGGKDARIERLVDGQLFDLVFPLFEIDRFP